MQMVTSVQVSISRESWFYDRSNGNFVGLSDVHIGKI